MFLVDSFHIFVTAKLKIFESEASSFLKFVYLAAKMGFIWTHGS